MPHHIIKKSTVLAELDDKQNEYLQLLEKIITEIEDKPIRDGGVIIDHKDYTELKEWATGVSKLCIRGNTSMVYDELEPRRIIVELANRIEISSTLHKDQFKEKSEYTYGSLEREIDILRSNIILDAIYDNVDKGLPYFRTEEEFTPYAPRYAPLQTILSAMVIRSKQTVDKYLSSSTCSTNNKSYHRFADRSIFYNSLSAGLSSLVLSQVSKNFKFDFKTNLFVDVISTLAIQIHMVKSIASLGNLNVNDDSVRTLIYLCIASDEIKGSITEKAKKLTIITMEKIISNIPKSVLKTINKHLAIKLISETARIKIPFYLLTSKFPFIGELNKFVHDSMSSYRIGKTTKYILCPIDEKIDQNQDISKSSLSHNSEL
ncbi:hypothetical protein Glove_214g38 [Diversispora epigaea]|uniref:Uncharacterized protein n=1 Tax=Diversispora epigaea TaxID=1348612 RepID=A0A397IRR5_9GLOM|nr:hypothetical protein Glove_214g38 [Diversispora epigaea]